MELVIGSKKLITGFGIFAGFPDEFFEGSDFVRTPEKDAIFEKIRKNNDLHQEISKILESEYPLYKKEQDDRRKRVARNRERYSK